MPDDKLKAAYSKGLAVIYYGSNRFVILFCMPAVADRSKNGRVNLIFI